MTWSDLSSITHSSRYRNAVVAAVEEVRSCAATSRPGKEGDEVRDKPRTGSLSSVRSVSRVEMAYPCGAL